MDGTIPFLPTLSLGGVFEIIDSVVASAAAPLDPLADGAFPKERQAILLE
jgi:hypothetical protein